MKIPETLLLTGREIKQALTDEDCFRAVESAFRAHGEGKMLLPPKIYLTLPNHRGDFRAMPAYLENPARCGVKWVNVHPGNRRYSLPTVMAIVILNDPRTGFPLAILDGTWITKMRTGAAGAVAAKFLARKNSQVLGLVGCGVQAETQLLFLSRIFRFKKIKFWGLTSSDRETFFRRARPFRRILEGKGKIRDVAGGVDILVTTTPSRRPLVRSGWVSPGTHVNAIGADSQGKEELDPRLLQKGRIFVDDWHQASASGEINVPVSGGLLQRRDIAGTLGEVVCGKKMGRRDPDEVTIFDSTGLAIQDVAVAWKGYLRAKQHGTGKKIRFF